LSAVDVDFFVVSGTSEQIPEVLNTMKRSNNYLEAVLGDRIKIYF
jgi:hypothetical protein